MYSVGKESVCLGMVFSDCLAYYVFQFNITQFVKGRDGFFCYQNPLQKALAYE